MWKAFEISTRENAPQAAILYEKFHVLRHPKEALDKVRRSEFARIKGPDRRFFDSWRESLKPQRLPSYVKFAEMIERHWDGIAAYSSS